MKVTVITPKFAFSGVPLAQIRLAQSLQRKGFIVDLIIGNIPNENDLPDLSNIKVHNLKACKVRYMLIKLMTHLIKSKPDVVFSAEDHLNLVVIFAHLLTRSKSKLSCSSRVTPYDTFSKRIFSKRWFLKNLYFIFQNRANVLSCVSKDMVLQYKEIFRNSRHQTIYNIIDPNLSSDLIEEPLTDKNFTNTNETKLIAAGTLAEWKGFDLLIEAISIIPENFKFKLFILGDGPEKAKLQNLIKLYSLNDTVFLLGNVKNTLKYFKASDIFVLSSRVEGMPNVLIEAMMCGCTPVSFDCKTGPREILTSNEYGYLAEPNSVESLSNAIVQALEKRIALDKLNERVSLFSEDAVLNKHFSLLDIDI